MKIKFNFKVFITALLMALLFTFSLGVFANAPMDMKESFEGRYWFYINRGYPVAWAGVRLADSEISLPHVTVPFINFTDDQGTEFLKIIDLNIFIPLILIVLLIVYFPVYMFVKAIDENKKLNAMLVLGSVLIFALFIYVYLFEFSRL